MTRFSKILCLILVLSLFAAMAIGSGSDSSTSSGSGTETKSTSAPATEKDESPVIAATEAPAKTEAPVKTEAPQSVEAYEVGEGKVNVYKNSIGTYWAQVCVPVTNTGSCDLYLSSGTMDLEDADGHLVDSLQLVSVYPEVLQPGETAWYYEETTLDNEPASELKVVPHVDVAKAKVKCIRFDLSDVTISDDTFSGVKIVGRVENTTSKDEKMVYVVFFLYDEQDEMIGSAFTILTDGVKAGEKVGFTASTFAAPDSVTADKVSRYEAYAYPMQLQF